MSLFSTNYELITMLEEMYKEIILDHWQNPQNRGLLPDFDLEGQAVNQLCGDGLLIRIKFKNDLISGISFDGEGCAISQASASLLTENIKGKSRDELKNLTQEVALKLLQIEVIPSRLKCALLPLRAIGKALSQESQT